MGLVLWTLGALLLQSVCGQAPHIRNLHARFDPQQDSVYVSWTAPYVKDDLQYQVKYRLLNREDDWHYIRVQETEARLEELTNLRNGDEVEVEVKSELDGANPGQSLVINVVKQLQVDGLTLEEDDLLPPLNFQAHILDPYTVKLQWRPYNLNPNAFYIVNSKQLTPRNEDNLFRQQVRVEETEFVLRNLEPGEKYEFTIRTATAPDHTSSTAAIVEITMPGAEEYYEVGNLLISSKFNLDGTGTVNLTWEVPRNMKDKIQGYHVEYTPEQAKDWKKLYFDGSSPTTILTDLTSDTQYLLKIRTVLKNNLETDSGEFKFKTPRIPRNPIEKVDVIYSSETSDVRLQWELKRDEDSNAISGYVVYINEDPDAPEHVWRRIQHNSADKSVLIAGLLTDTTYYVRITPILSDGTVQKSTVVYRFTTLSHQPRHHHKRHRRHLRHYIKITDCYDNKDCKSSERCTQMEDGKWCLPRVRKLAKNIDTDIMVQKYVIYTN
ncbi:unnamed protein product [Bursaphelenchus xylophilus]|uniref:(pine wood nematode) hypothetical protein n=1 Tax=Bursaphelenchus xylophilus TaxID=6326 RepID=A0A1I7SQN1_BURXY|nr:unnamed protein product [Bursaphelenchus xylophilus]CAG9110134.1 unnamed protein product [Bursaphelenchus xylophilus]